MSGEAIRCPGCRELVNVANLEAHYKSGHTDGIVKGATTITTANPTDNQRYPNPYLTPQHSRVHAFDSPVWGPLLRRYFPHIVFGAFVIGAIIGILAW
jgi:hypothetical protein